jgi:hypothetical protein
MLPPVAAEFIVMAVTVLVTIVATVGCIEISGTGFENSVSVEQFVNEIMVSNTNSCFIYFINVGIYNLCQCSFLGLFPRENKMQTKIEK